MNGRQGILAVHTRKVPLGDDVQLDIISRGTPGFSGADLENLVNEAALLAARQDKDLVSMADFEMAKDKVMMGSERRSMVISEHERKTTAYHEAGHTLVAWMLPNHDPIHKVTIIPRGPALGLTMALPEEDRQSGQRRVGDRPHRDGARRAPRRGSGVRSADHGRRRRLQEGDSTGALDGHRMGDEHESWPAVVRREAEESGFLGQTYHKDYSEQTAKEIDDEVRRIINTQYDRAKFVIEEHREKLDAIAEALLERETLGREEIEAIMNGEDLPPARRGQRTDLRGKAPRERRETKGRDLPAAAPRGPERRVVDGGSDARALGRPQRDARLL